jgi:hypothetical protein
MSAIKDGPSTYIKANRSFWQSSTKNRAESSLLADHWIDMTSDKKDSAAFTKDLSKGNILSSCGEGRSTTYAGNAVLNGVKVNKVHQNSSGSPTRTTSKTAWFHIC